MFSAVMAYGVIAVIPQELRRIALLAVAIRLLLWLVLLGHRREVEEMLLFSCQRSAREFKAESSHSHGDTAATYHRRYLSRNFDTLKKNTLLIVSTFFAVLSPSITKFFQKFFQEPLIPPLLSDKHGFYVPSLFWRSLIR